MVRGWWLVYTGKTRFDVGMLVDSGAILKLALLDINTYICPFTVVDQKYAIFKPHSPTC